MKLTKLSWYYLIPLWGLVWILSGCGTDHSRLKAKSDAYYTCSMHPQVHKEKPGKCPICGMKLIKVTSSGQNAASLDSSLRYLTEPVTQTVIGAFKVVEAVKASAADTITAQGYIDFDKRDLNTISSRVTGRIEKLYVKYSNQSIKKGQPLMDIYSPELLSIQRNLLQVLKDRDSALISGIKDQLLNLGMRVAEVQKVIQSGQPLTEVTIYSPFSGILTKTNAASGQMAMSEGQADMDMAVGRGDRVTTAQSDAQPEPLGVGEGMYVDRGQTIFSIQNIHRAWALLDVFTPDVWRLHRGDAVRLYAEASPGHALTGQVDFVPPARLQQEKTASIRVYLDHLPPAWKIGTLIQGKIAVAGAGAPDQVFVPLSAINRLGQRTVVWVQDKQHQDVFHVRNVKTGIQTSQGIQILKGIAAGDKIAANAAYMVDSDSFIE
ncbi:efflux RND transporter periplasmic adaptor subunit [Arachidicoccus terrestris]|uniref:efflux RND transporter periplasmic adaptor subunit n=1 Tax=Arachidicoccus terrestris TaxID=2875539 RepID=UPI001CC4782A|nr:efflux RND transporter periplasmic adaptor subunit [Arachidicoccus terrestris]UAY55381.1 efflux RND transporter periplasmic adaptor subunit [Arachidicoccus terrestris]